MASWLDKQPLIPVGKYVFEVKDFEERVTKSLANPRLYLAMTSEISEGEWQGFKTYHTISSTFGAQKLAKQCNIPAEPYDNAVSLTRKCLNQKFEGYIVHREYQGKIYTQLSFEEPTPKEIEERDPVNAEDSGEDP